MSRESLSRERERDHKRRGKRDRREYMRRYHKLRQADGRTKLWRQQILKHYGGKCACCGETTPEFLALDHRYGGGNNERKANGLHGGGGFYQLVINQGFPDRYRLLCHNCNCALGTYKKCPHGMVFEPEPGASAPRKPLPLFKEKP